MLIISLFKSKIAKCLCTNIDAINVINNLMLNKRCLTILIKSIIMSLTQVFSSVGIVWKGSGFYKTDSRADSSTKTSKASKASGDSSAKTDSSAQSAPSTDSQVAGTSKPSESSSSNTSDSHKGALKVEKSGSKNKEKNK